MTGIPLTYILHESAAVTDKALAHSYPTIDDDLIGTAKHSGCQFWDDNQHVFTLYKQFIIDGLAWAYAKGHARNQDGHEAYLSTKHRLTGTAARTLKKKQAYAQIDTTKYTRHGCYTFSEFVHRHQKAHNILTNQEEM